MAATLLRDVYDCVVVGNGRTAGLVAAAVARSGRQTLHVSPPSQSRPAWLHPRWMSAWDGEECQRSPLSGVSVINAAAQRTTVLRAAALQGNPSARSAADSLELPVGCRLTCDTPREVRLNGALPATTIRANLVIATAGNCSAVSASQTAIGGIYRDVACAAGEERQAQLFATQREGQVFWLVPREEGMWSLGLLCPPGKEHSEQPTEHSLAGIFEEALVACPALTQRLMSAELIGGLHLAQATNSPADNDWPGAIPLPAYDGWLDPVFASSDWLAAELASQVALHMLGSDVSTDRVLPAKNRLADWRQHWSAVEQLTSERIAPWYRLHEALPAALHDHAQRTWYEKLLSGQRLQ